MKIVLDANIFVSAILWGGNPRTIFLRVVNGLDTLFITDEIIEEIDDVIRRPKFRVSQERADFIIRSIENVGRKITAAQNQITGGSRDADDNKYLECGVAGKADYIISGDIHLLELKNYGGVSIVTAKEYLEIVSNSPFLI